jgi:hypothetical protein
MRLNDLNDGSIKTLLILILLGANIAVAIAHRRAEPQPPGSARASRAVFGAFAENSAGSGAARALQTLPSPLQP